MKTKENRSGYWASYDNLLFSQLFNHFFLSIYFAFISLNYVCIEKSVWVYVPFKNKIWTRTIVIVVLLHMIYLIISLYMIDIDRALAYCSSIPFEYWAITLVWPVILIVLNEFYKLFEIK